MYMTTLPVADARSHLSKLIEAAMTTHERFEITRNGRRAAVLLSADDYDTLQETIAVLSDTDTLRQLAASDAELARGEGESEQSLAEAMRRRGASA